jgi:hypothetical protein
MLEDRTQLEKMQQASRDRIADFTFAQIVESIVRPGLF